MPTKPTINNLEGCNKNKPTEAQLKYWELMKGKTRELTPRWKGESAGKQAKHQYLNKHYGRPSICENPECEGKSKAYDWCLKTGREYTHDRNDYLRMCRVCHRKYDLTPEKKQQAIKNLWWKKGDKNPGAEFKFVKGHIMKPAVLKFIKDTIETPYSVSEWRRIGIERGYYDYFKEDLRKHDMEELIKYLDDNGYRSPNLKGMINYYYNK